MRGKATLVVKLSLRVFFIQDTNAQPNPSKQLQENESTIKERERERE